KIRRADRSSLVSRQPVPSNRAMTSGTATDTFCFPSRCSIVAPIQESKDPPHHGLGRFGPLLVGFECIAPRHRRDSRDRRDCADCGYSPVEGEYLGEVYLAVVGNF